MLQGMEVRREGEVGREGEVRDGGGRRGEGDCNK